MNKEDVIHKFDNFFVSCPTLYPSLLNSKFVIYTGRTKVQMMSCMLKLNATVWQQKLNTEDIGG